MVQVSVKMPQVPFGPHTISRLIVGGNQQLGAAHANRDMSMHMLEYFTLDRTVEFLRDCLVQGIDTWQGNYHEKCRDALFRLREEGKDMQLIPISAPRVAGISPERIIAMVERHEQAWDDMMNDFKPIGVFLWGLLTDILWREKRIDTARDFLKRVRDAGVQVGVATHIPEVVEYIEEKGWDVDFYMASLYKWGKSPEEILAIMPEIPVDGHRGYELYVPSEPVKMCDTIRKTQKTCLAFKLFAAGRAATTPEQVSEVYEYVFGHIKPTDAVVVGMYPRFHDQMVTENADLVKKFG